MRQVVIVNVPVTSFNTLFASSSPYRYAKSNSSDAGDDGHGGGEAGFAQYLYRCLRCDTVVCLVCRERCHKDHGPAERLGACTDGECVSPF